MNFSNPLKLSVVLLTSAVFVSCGGGDSSGGVSSPSAGSTPLVPTENSEVPEIKIAVAGDILLNQHGYINTEQKIASYVDAGTAPLTWQLLDAADRVYASGETISKGMSPLSGLSTHEINFSDYRTIAPNVRLKIGDNESETFDISARPFETLAKDSAKYFYQNRAATAIETAHVARAFPYLSRAAGHTKQDMTCFSGTDDFGTTWPSCGYNKTISMGWYDAGDYGLYAVNTGMTLWTLQNQYEQLLGEQKSCKIRNSATRELNIPESDNDIHDLLDEARIGMELMLSLQIDTDTPIAMALGEQAEGSPLTLTQQSARGMLHHKVHGLEFPADNVIPEDDIQTRYLYPPSTSATLHLAATGAQCARVWDGIDDGFAQRCKDAAIKAYEAAKSIPDAYAYNNFDGGGPYADVSLRDEFSWAATELYLTTGQMNYADDILTYTPNGYATHGRVQAGWRDTEPLGMLSIATQFIKNPSRIATPLEQEALDGLSQIAEQYNDQRLMTGFNVPDDDPEYFWGSNYNLMNRAILLAIVSDAQDISYKDDIISVLDYMLGHNPLNQSYISAYGEQSFENPHHRFWSNAIDKTNPKPPAGVLSSGPNNTSMIDPISSQLEGSCVAQTCWVDEFDAYTFNEVAISYNSGLLWVADWLNNKAATCEN